MTRVRRRGRAGQGQHEAGERLAGARAHDALAGAAARRRSAPRGSGATPERHKRRRPRTPGTRIASLPLSRRLVAKEGSRAAGGPRWAASDIRAPSREKPQNRSTQGRFPGSRVVAPPPAFPGFPSGGASFAPLEAGSPATVAGPRRFSTCFPLSLPVVGGTLTYGRSLGAAAGRRQGQRRASSASAGDGPGQTGAAAARPCAAPRGAPASGRSTTWPDGRRRR